MRRQCVLHCFLGTSSLRYFLYRKTTCTWRQLRLTCFMVVRLILLQFYHRHVLCVILRVTYMYTLLLIVRNRLTRVYLVFLGREGIFVLIIM